MGLGALTVVWNMCAPSDDAGQVAPYSRLFKGKINKSTDYHKTSGEFNPREMNRLDFTSDFDDIETGN